MAETTISLVIQGPIEALEPIKQEVERDPEGEANLFQVQEQLGDPNFWVLTINAVAGLITALTPIVLKLLEEKRITMEVDGVKFTNVTIHEAEALLQNLQQKHEQGTRRKRG